MLPPAPPDRAQAPYRHRCLGFAGPAEFEARALEFLARGLLEGQRVLYVVAGDPDEATGRLRAVEIFDRGAARGAVLVASLEATYSPDAVIDPEEQVRAYAAATEEALAAGYTGLRVAADVTPLVRTPAQLDAFARYEHLVDRYMVTRPMSAMCAYDRVELGDVAVAQVACLHPGDDGGAAPFRLHAHARAGADAALEGELDVAAYELWPLALERAGLSSAGGEVVIDATGLGFIDHRNLLALAGHAERHGTTAVLRTPLSHPAHVLQVLGVTRVRVERVR